MKNDNATNKIAQDVLRRQSQMFGMRAMWESLWWQIDQRVNPSPNCWFGNRPPQGAKWNMHLFDSTAGLALDKFKAILESILTPRNSKWHTLLTNAPALEDDVEIQRYLDQVNDILFKARYTPRANFASQMNEVYLSLGKFGTGCLFVDDVMGDGLRYKSIHLSELFISENAYGIVDTIHRKFQYTARQAAEFFGIENLPEIILKSLDKADTYDNKFDFIHAVQPNPDYNPKSQKLINFKFLSHYVCCASEEMVRSGGYNSMPYLVTRYYTESNEVYGRGPATFALPDIQTLNEMKKTILRQAQLAVDPPIMVSEDGVMQSFSMQPGALNYGYLNDQGIAQAQPFQTGANFQVAELMITGQEKIINDSFLVTLFQILSVDNPNMTATEVIQRAQEKGMLLAPAMGRQQSELLGPLIERELDILARAGALPPMPQVMIDMQGGDDFKIQYESELARSQKLGDAQAIVQTMGIVGQAAQMDPSVLNVFDTNKMVRKIAEINGVPADCIRSVEEVAAIQQQQAQQQAMQQAMNNAPQVASAAKDAAQAQQISQDSGQGKSIVPGLE